MANHAATEAVPPKHSALWIKVLPIQTDQHVRHPGPVASPPGGCPGRATAHEFKAGRSRRPLPITETGPRGSEPWTGPTAANGSPCRQGRHPAGPRHLETSRNERLHVAEAVATWRTWPRGRRAACGNRPKRASAPAEGNSAGGSNRGRHRPPLSADSRCPIHRHRVSMVARVFLFCGRIRAPRFYGSNFSARLAGPARPDSDRWHSELCHQPSACDCARHRRKIPSERKANGKSLLQLLQRSFRLQSGGSRVHSGAAA